MSEFLLALDDVLYYPILIIVLLAAGLYFTFTTGFVQFRWLRQSIRVIMEKPEKEGFFRALRLIARTPVRAYASGYFVLFKKFSAVTVLTSASSSGLSLSLPLR